MKNKQGGLGMNENNFSLQRALDGSYLNIALTEPVQLDNIAIKVIDEDCPNFLFPFKLFNINDGVTLKYKLTNDIALSYASMSFTKSAFVDFYQGLLRPFLQGADWFLDYHYICLNEAYVYINKNMSIAEYVYIPEASYRNSDEDIVKFFQGVLNKVEITDDNNLLLHLYQYFNRNNVVLTELDEMLKHERINYAEPIEKPEPVVIQPIDTKEAPIQQPVVAEPPKQEKSSDDELMDMLFGGNSKKKKEKPKKVEKNKKVKKFGLFGKKQETDTVKQEQLTENIEVNENPNKEIGNNYYRYAESIEDENTEMSEDNCDGVACLDLVESVTAGAIQRISLDFQDEYITIGRDSHDTIHASIRFNATFKQISRMHARIERNGDKYYLIDLGSANKTMLNNQILIPNNPYILKNGDRITFATNLPVIYRVIL
jgi:hypothetical protein